MSWVYFLLGWLALSCLVLWGWSRWRAWEKEIWRDLDD